MNEYKFIVCQFIFKLQAHSSLEKNAVIAMVKLRHLPSDEKLSLRGEALKTALEQDRKRGLIPFYVSILMRNAIFSITFCILWLTDYGLS